MNEEFTLLLYLELCIEKVKVLGDKKIPRFFPFLFLDINEIYLFYCF